MKNNLAKNRLIVLASLVAGICFLVGFLASSQIPRLRTWVLVKIEKESRENLPVRILPGAIDVNFLPIGTTLHDVRIFPKDEIKDILDPVQIKRLAVSVSLWQLLQGKLRLSSVTVEGADVSVRIPKSEKRGGKPLEGLFSTLNSIPVSRLNLNDVSVRLMLESPNLSVAVEHAVLEAEKQRSGFSLVVEEANVRIRDPETKAAVLLSVEASVSASADKFLVEALKIRRGDSFFTASGRGQGDTEALDLKDLDLAVRAELKLDSMRDWTAKTFKNTSWAPKIPPLFGRAFVDGRVKREHGKSPSGDLRLRTEQFAVRKIALGQIETQGSFKNDLMKLPLTTITNPAGQVIVQNAALQFGEGIAINGTLKIPSVDTHELLNQLGVGRIGVYMKLSGEAPCTGKLSPEFFIDCKGAIRGDGILVKTGIEKTDSVIVAVPQISVNGTVHILPDTVSYKADVAMPNSKGTSSGEIGFETGFKIDFESEKFAFKDISNLSNLRIEGAARVKGTTQGSSHAASVVLNLDGDDLWFENYWLGNTKGVVGYKAGRLTFDELQGNYSVSRYSGNVAVDVVKKRVEAALRVPFFDAKDLLKAFSRRVQLSFPVTGTGQANIKVSGPLEFNHLSYDLKSSVFRGSVMGETFDQANFDVKSVGGEVKAERVQLTKSGAAISLTGVAHPDGNIETVVKGRGIRLEDTNTVAKSSLALSGVVDFDMAMTGYVLAPDTDLHGTLSRTSLGDQAMPDSTFRLRFGKNSISGAGKFLGDIVDGDFTIPLSADAPFRLKLSTNEWNYAPVFSALAGPASRKDYEGLLTANVELSSASGGFWNATGEGKIETFSLARGALKLRNEAPLGFSMKNGQVHVQNFNLSGNNIFVNVVDNPNPSSKLDLGINGKVDLGLLALMTPFFEDLRGLLSFKLQMKGGETPLQLLGSAFVEKGYLKFFDFPHAFEDIRADLLFNQRRVVFNSVRAEFGGGRISAGGSMELRGPKDTPLQVTGTFDKITLAVPQDIRTTGSGDFTFTGNWFPFLLKGNFVVSDGLFKKPFGGDANSVTSGVRRDVYLPDFLIEENFVPLILDMNVDLGRGMTVKNELMDGKVLGSLSLKGSPTKPAIAGTITTDRETKVSFRETEFEVVSANVQFNGSTDINPRLYVSARSRVETYDVNLLVQGTGSKPELILTSVPPLPERDIVSLLAFGATDLDLDKNIKSNQQASNTGLQVGTGIIKNNPLNAAIKERLGFDVQFTTGYDESNTAMQKIVASRQVNQNLGVSASYSLGKSQETEAKVRYRLNERVSLVGNYKGREYSETDVQQQQIYRDPNRFGLDVEYKFEFK